MFANFRSDLTQVEVALTRLLIFDSYSKQSTHSCPTVVVFLGLKSAFDSVERERSSPELHTRKAHKSHSSIILAYFWSLKDIQ